MTCGELPRLEIVYSSLSLLTLVGSNPAGPSSGWDASLDLPICRAALSHQDSDVHRDTSDLSSRVEEMEEHT